MCERECVREKRALVTGSLRRTKIDPVWNTFSQHTDGSLQWIPKHILTIKAGKNFHRQGESQDYSVPSSLYDKKEDTWELSDQK